MMCVSFCSLSLSDPSTNYKLCGIAHEKGFRDRGRRGHGRVLSAAVTRKTRAAANQQLGRIMWNEMREVREVRSKKSEVRSEKWEARSEK